MIVTAHAIGHLLGAVHDENPLTSYLRGPGAGARDTLCQTSDEHLMVNSGLTVQSSRSSFS